MSSTDRSFPRATADLEALWDQYAASPGAPALERSYGSAIDFKNPLTQLLAELVLVARAHDARITELEAKLAGTEPTGTERARLGVTEAEELLELEQRVVQLETLAERQRLLGKDKNR